jgi:hypothetical protein
MQYQVPQNITMEDRILGPITTTQFVILVVGGLSAFFVLNQTWLPGSIETWLAGGMALLVALVALGKFNDQPLYRFGKFIIAFLFTSKIRVWKKGSPQPVLIKPSEHRVQERQRNQKRVTRVDIARVAQVVDTRGRAGVVPTIKDR